MVGDPSERPGAAPRQFRLEPSPRLRTHHEEPRLELEAGEPIDPLYQPKTPRGRRDPTFGAGPRRAEAAWRDTRAPRRRSAVVPVAVGLLLIAAGAVALWYHETPSPPVAEAVTPPPVASLTPPAPAPSLTPATTVPTPLLPPQASPIRPAAVPHAMAPLPAKKADADLPRDMLQPQIVAAPPALPSMPAAKRELQPVRAAAALQPVKPAAADTALPAPIAAVLHPEAAPPPASAAAPASAPTSPTATATTSTP